LLANVVAALLAIRTNFLQHSRQTTLRQWVPPNLRCTTRAEEYAAAARAYRLLMVTLQGEGLGEVAARYSYRAQIMQRKRRFYERRWGAYLGSGFLALLTGYGYRLWRILAAYVV
jgi:hypothetical protein